MNKLLEKIKKFEFKKPQNRKESYEIINVEEDDILEYQRNISQKSTCAGTSVIDTTAVSSSSHRVARMF